MSKVHPLKKMKTSDLKINPENPRDDLDIQPCIEETIQKGRIIAPLIIRFEDNVVLQGNRRLRTAQTMLAQPNLPSDLKEALMKLDCIAYEGLTPEETTHIVYDHGGQKPLSRVEIVKAVWKLHAQMYSFAQIITVMYHLLAKFTGNSKKAYEAQSLPAGGGRTEYLKKWFKGTVDDYLLTAATLGPRVKEQVLLYERNNERVLSDEEKRAVAFWCNRNAVMDLRKGKNKDKESPQGWDQEKGGTEFNKIWDKLAFEFKNGAPAILTPAPTKKQMEDRADTFKSDMKLTYLHCAGKLTPEQANKVDELDTELYRIGKIKDVLRENIDLVDLAGTFGGGEVRELLSSFLAGTEAEFATTIKKFIKSV